MSLGLVLGCVAPNARADVVGAPAAKLTHTLTDMGYEDVLVQDCNVSFMRRVEPTENNNGFFAYERSINLNMLQNLSRAEIVEHNYDGDVQYVMELELDEASDRAYQDVIAFGAWVQDTYPTAGWPYLHPSLQDEFSPKIEFELTRKFEDLAFLNRYTNYSRYGASTFIETETIVVFSDERDELEELWLRLIEYSIQAECAVES